LFKDLFLVINCI